ncbi:MAG: 4Fe-4S cluster-binding domain-containing protein [Candidatus Nanoarchaeia archaeon]
MDNSIVIVEKFLSIQGESTFAGRLSHFLRLGACNLNCRYCDTPYSKDARQFQIIPIKKLLQEYSKSPVKLLTITGGEPLLQKASCIMLMRELLELKFTILLETNGSLSLKGVPRKVVKILDCKCPLSGESETMDFANFARIDSKDQIKFVISGKKDYEYSKEILLKYKLLNKTKNILLSPAGGFLEPAKLAEWMKKDMHPGILNLQLHKIIWPDKDRGV